MPARRRRAAAKLISCIISPTYYGRIAFHRSLLYGIGAQVHKDIMLMLHAVRHILCTRTIKYAQLTLTSVHGRVQRASSSSFRHPPANGSRIERASACIRCTPGADPASAAAVPAASQPRLVKYTAGRDWPQRAPLRGHSPARSTESAPRTTGRALADPRPLGAASRCRW